MPFKVTDKKWLEKESARVGEIILMPKFWHRAWTDQSLHEALNGLGLTYSLPEVRLLNDELHNQGIVEDINQPAPGPEPDPAPPV